MNLNVPVDASGDQVVLSSGDLRLTVVTVGGGMRELTHGGKPVLWGYGADEVAVGAQGQVLAPWPNRLAGGRYEFEGHRYQLPLTEPSKHNALHGFARWERWSVIRHEAATAVLGIVLAPRSGYPFALALEVEYRVGLAGVDVAILARNAGRHSLPYAAGFHPYFSAGTPAVDGSLLEIPARTRLTTDERQIPNGHMAVDGTEYDFRRARTIGSMRLDTAFTGFERETDGQTRIRLSAPDGTGSVAVRLGPAFGYAMVYSGDTLADESMRRRSLAVEPMTAAPNAFETGEGLIVLAPGETHRAEWGIEIAPGL
jgi:aldose 1-epimerase